MSRKVDLVLYSTMAIVSGGALWIAHDWPLDARLFPFLTGSAALAMVAIALFSQMRGNRAQPGAEEKRAPVVQKELAAFAWIAGFFVAVAFVGFQWGLPGMILIYLKIEGSLRWVLSLIFAATCWLFLYAMRMYLHLPLYDGFLLEGF